MYCAAYSAHQIVKNTQALVNQNLKDNQALLENGKGLPARVLRAESEVENIKALLIEADNKKGKAAQYLNFLVNRPLDQEVPFEEAVLDLARINYLLGEENQEGNSELLAVKTAVSIQETVLKSQKSYWIPKLSTYADFGSQGFDWTFDSQSRYTMWGLQLSVPVFQGGRNQNQIQRGNLGLQSIQRQKELLGKKLALELQLQKNEVKSILATLQSSEKKIVSAGAYLRLVDRGFKEGSLSLIEYLDAQNQWTQASLQKNIATYNLQMALAQLERLLTTSN
jgi:outer membrane protein TolC